MNDYKLALLIIKHKNKLNKLVDDKEEYSKILKENRRLHHYITQRMINEIESKKITSS